LWQAHLVRLYRVTVNHGVQRGHSGVTGRFRASGMNRQQATHRRIRYTCRKGADTMTDNVENLILEHLKGFRSEFREFRGRYDRDVEDIKHRLTTIERGPGSV
jgi:hypothetical protein